MTIFDDSSRVTFESAASSSCEERYHQTAGVIVESDSGSSCFGVAGAPYRAHLARVLEYGRELMNRLHDDKLAAIS